MDRKSKKYCYELERMLNGFVDGAATREEVVGWARSVEHPSGESPFRGNRAREFAYIALWNGLEVHPRSPNEYCFRLSDAHRYRLGLNGELPELGPLDDDQALFYVRHDLDTLALRLNRREERYVSPGIGWQAYAVVPLGNDCGHLYLEQSLLPDSAGCTDIYTIGVTLEPAIAQAQALLALGLDSASLLFNT